MLRFGLQQPSHTFQDPPGSAYRWVERIAIEAELLGYDSFWIMDHLVQIPNVATASEPILEAYVTLSAIAAKTSRIKIGSLCTSNTFRDPALLAKMAATLDVVSGGRLFFGIGAGWFEAEHIQYGIPFFTTAERIRRLEEAVQVIKKIWTEERATFKGRYYHINELICSPKPIQRPHPPILIGGSGEKMTLKVVANHANACNLFGGSEVIKHKLNVLRAHCEKIGRDYGEILKTKLGGVVISRTDKEAYSKLQKVRPTHISLEQYRQQVIWGSPDRCVDEVQKLIDAGIEYLIVNFPGPYDPMNTQVFAEKVMPAFKS